MADNSAPVQEPPKEKKKRKSNIKKSDLPSSGVPSEEASPAPESRKTSLATPTSQDDGRKTSLATPSSQDDGRKASLATPTSQDDGRKASVATPTSQDDGRKASLATPSSQDDGRKVSLATPTSQDDGRKVSLAPPASQDDGRKATLAPPTHEYHESNRSGSFKQEERPKRRYSARKASSVLEDLDESKLLDLKEAFKLFDLDQDGYISNIDLKQTFGTLGKTDVTDEEIQQMLSEAANPLDFDAFVMLLGFKTISLDPEEILLDALGKWDKNKSGFIQEEKIRHDLMTWGDKFTEKEVDVALEDAPTFVNNGVNMIDYIKFCKLLCGLRKKTRDITIEDFLK